MPDNRAEPEADPRLYVLPVQVIEIAEGVLLSRGLTQIRLTGRGAFDLVQDVLTALQPPGHTRAELLAGVAGPERAKLNQLLNLLVARRLVVPADDIPSDVLRIASERFEPDKAEDVFFWDFGLNAADVRARFAEQRVHIAGVNRVALALAQALAESGFTDLSLVDAPLLRNLSLFDDGGALLPEALAADGPPVLAEPDWRASVEAAANRLPSILIVASDFGGKALLRPWNEWAVGAGVPFFPVVLQQLVGSIGPFVQPFETPCYECVRGRENSNMDDPATQRALESMAFEGQFATGAHPLMPQLIAQHAAFELTKLLSGIGKGPVGRLITVNPLDCDVSEHRILKLPFCPVCGTNARHARSALGDIGG